ncbi:MAG: site-specific DNA-methyltransferase [Pyrinomonadaceae bacterium]|nr:site-specific DNA-methyltransferase [Pyrinomonadaceae bacterium]
MSDAKLQLSWENRGKYAKETITPIVLKFSKSKSANAEDNPGNMVIEGNNLDVMAALLTGGFSLRGQVDLCLWDPPYNTGKNDFRYNDDFYLSKKEVEILKAKAPVKEDWDVVSITDPSRHTKWLNFMEVRLRKAQELLKPGGIIAVCIGYEELFRLGCLMDEIFDEDNRLGIINWQKKYSPTNDSNHLSPSTEYVLIYANNKTEAETGLLARTEKMNSKYSNPDDDPEGEWRISDATVKTYNWKSDYGIQSPFTGAIHYPGRGCWNYTRRSFKEWLEKYGSEYIELDDPTRPNNNKSLVLKGAKFSENGILETPSSVLAEAEKKARKVAKGVLPFVLFGGDGKGVPSCKRHLKYVKQGRVPMTYWADEDYEIPFYMGSQSWEHTESGHSQSGISELNAVIGKGHKFDTVKPLKLIEKIIQIWCPFNGRVLDAFGGSGTVGHAVLNLNNTIENSNRKFILIERGNGEDKFCNKLTAERVRRVINGNWAIGNQNSLDGGFAYYKSGGKITRKAIMEAAHEQLADIILQSADDVGDRIDCRLENPTGYIVGKTRKGQAIALVWRDTQILTDPIYYKILQEAKALNMKTPVFIYARANDALDDDGYQFCLIPDKILAALNIPDTPESEE